MILVAGGAGYIGSHTCLELLKAGYEVIVFDNFSNSYIESIRRLERITKKISRLLTTIFATKPPLNWHCVSTTAKLSYISPG